MAFDHNEFDQDKSIEPGQLDVEAIRQADLFFKWAEKSVAARAEVERQEFQLKNLEARLQIEIREKPEKVGLKNATETAIKSAVQIHPKLIEATEAYYRSREISALLDKAVMALEQKKRMIEVLITLHGQEYFAGPSVPRNLVEAWTEHQTKQEDALGVRQRAGARRRVRREE